MTVKKLLIVPLAMALACGGTSGNFSKDSAASAMPNGVAMNTPGGTSSSSKANPNALTATPNAVSNDFYFGLTVSVAVIFNVPVAAFLGLVETITQNEPTSCDATSCTWGPGSAALDANTYKLVVSQDTDGLSYDWELDGQAKSKPTSAFVTVVSGVAKPSGTAHHGSGTFTVNFDNANTLDGVLAGAATGKMVVNSYSNVGPAQLSVTYTGATDSSTNGLENIAYSYADDSTGGGDLQFAVHNTKTSDDFSVHSRWENDGEGRADVQGSGGGLAVKESDCWGAAPFTNVYFTSNITVDAPPFAGPTTGSASACAFTDTVYSSLTVQ
jgi:hypothetical protein